MCRSKLLGVECQEKDKPSSMRCLLGSAQSEFTDAGTIFKLSKSQHSVVGLVSAGRGRVNIRFRGARRGPSMGFQDSLQNLQGYPVAECHLLR